MINWTADQESHFQQLLARREAAQAQKQTALATVASAMVEAYGYPATDDARAGIAVQFLPAALLAHGAELVAVLAPQDRLPLMPRKPRKKFGPSGLPPGVYRQGSGYSASIYDKATRRSAYIGYAATLEAAAEMAANALAARDANGGVVVRKKRDE